MDPEIIRTTQRNVCTIKVIEPLNELEQTLSVGCGVVLMTKVNGKNEYFIATVYHVVEKLFLNNKTQATISVFDKNGTIYKAGNIGSEHILWVNKTMDAALLVLPKDLQPEGNLAKDYVFPGLQNLKLIGSPDWGQDIYLFGYRWMNQDVFIDILKKGILSVGTSGLPGYEGNLVYLIDNMANKGMSGGLAFTDKGTGIGIISSYVNETNSRIQNSDDLTVCLPLTIFFNALSTIIISEPDRLNKLLTQ
ncbi:MAG: hypothetical protein R2750_12055 [Bacteroidales bacterium]